MFISSTGPADCAAGAALTGPAALSTCPRFGESTPGQQPGDRVLAVGEWENLCIELRADFSTGAPLGSTTSATFRIVADDEGLE